MGRAEELFFRILQGGADEISRMIRDEVVEEMFLDYKRSATTTPFTKLDISDRKNMAKAISGFANSEGGVIIWGVDCRQSPPNGDIPTGARLITNPTAFKSLLDNAIGGVTLPAHSEVENIAIHGGDENGGFVISHIPAGFNVPYRTLGDKEEYYIRAGSNFLPTPHAVLAGLFGRVPHSNLNIIPALQAIESSYGARPLCTIKLEISALNSGRGVAEDLFFSVEPNLPAGCTFRFDVSEHWTRWRTNNAGRDRLTIVSNSIPPQPPRLPPGSQNLMFVILLECGVPTTDEIIVDLMCGSARGPGSARRIKIPSVTIKGAVEHYTHKYLNAAEKKAGDQLHERAIRDCISSSK